MKKSPRVFVYCPYGNATGGTELLHQLVHKIGALGIQSSIVYWPAQSDAAPHEAFKAYNVRVADPQDICEDDVVVLPEIFARLRSSVHTKRIYCWWLSVDNYYFAKDFGRGKINRFILNRLNSQKYFFFEKSLKEIEGHLCQSMYAELHLKSKGIKSIRFLGDYINSSFFAEKITSLHRNNIVVYNPKKGSVFTQKVIEENPDIEFVPIVNMTREEVISLLKVSKVYLDLGYHPGMDRIPREAASLGCIVLTNKMGSAANDYDVPVGTNYKFALEGDFEKLIGQRIKSIFKSYEAAFSDLEQYRRMISLQEANFEKDVGLFLRQVGCQ